MNKSKHEGTSKVSPKKSSNAKSKSGGVSVRKASKAEAVQTPNRHARANSKLAKVIAMLRQPKGTNIEDISKATGWQAHSVRGAMSGAIKKKLGLTVTSAKTDGVRTYRIAD